MWDGMDVNGSPTANFADLHLDIDSVHNLHGFLERRPDPFNNIPVIEQYDTEFSMSDWGSGMTILDWVVVLSKARA